MNKKLLDKMLSIATYTSLVGREDMTASINDVFAVIRKLESDLKNAHEKNDELERKLIRKQVRSYYGDE